VENESHEEILSSKRAERKILRRVSARRKKKGTQEERPLQTKPTTGQGALGTLALRHSILVQKREKDRAAKRRKSRTYTFHGSEQKENTTRLSPPHQREEGQVSQEWAA